VSDAVLIALIALTGSAITAGPAYLGQRKTRRQLAEQGEATAVATAAALKDALAPVEKRLDQMGSRLDALGTDVADIRTRVAVQEDRWERGPLRVVESRNQP
jgi:hypothetical protein